jgi:branched-chain amino acid transport system permease protein
MRHLYLIMYGGASRPYVDYTIQRPFRWGPLVLLPKDVAIIGVALAVLLLVALLLLRTRTGTAMRAVADNKDLSEASGIDVEQIIMRTWMLGAALAALGGILQGIAQSVTWNMGFTLLLLMFAAVVVGGLGTAFGVMAGGLVIGVVSEVSTYWFSTEFKLVFALGALIAVLLVRPQGIFGRAERIG